MANLDSIKYAGLVIHSLRKNLRHIAKLHIYEINQRSSLSNQTPEKIKHQMQLLAVTIQNLTGLYGDDL